MSKLNALKDWAMTELALLDKAFESYHLKDVSLMSNDQYDSRLHTLKKLVVDMSLTVPEGTVLDRIGVVDKKFTSVVHYKKMYSMNDVFNKQGILDFLKDHKLLELIVEMKLDGLACSLIYENGNLVRALSRGDGLKGEDITMNVLMLSSVPKRLKDNNPPTLIEIRGEIYMNKSTLDRVNKEEGVELSNTRNAAAGTMRSLDPSIAARRQPVFTPYSLGIVEGELDAGEVTTQSKLLDWLVRCGFQKNIFKVVRTTEDMWTFIEEIGSLRPTLDYDIDGAVIKVNDLEKQKTIGYTLKHPKWACAYKYKAEAGTAIVKDIVLQLGRTGVYTPVAVFDDTPIGSVVVTRATLHNVGTITERGIMLGDRIVVERAGDVIPKVVGNLPGEDRKAFQIPKVCHSCQSPLSMEDKFLMCTNTSCEGTRLMKLIHFVSKRCMNIKGLGPKSITALFDEGKVSNFSSVYSLVNLPEIKETVRASIELSKRTSWERVLRSVSIPEIGEAGAKTLSAHYPDLVSLMKATEDELSGLDGVGPSISGLVAKWCSDTAVMSDIHNLLTHLILEKPLVASSALEGKTLVITGTHNIGRDEIKELVLSNGGKVSGNVSASTSVLLAGENAGSKLKKARSLNVEIWTLDDLKDYLDSKV